jgi:hypothetical protein
MPAVDIAISASFYQNVFGWNIRNNDGFISFDDAVSEVSGTWVTGLEPVNGKSLRISIMVFDMTASIEAVVANGGCIIQQPDMNATEKMATFTDSAGNVLGLYQHGG